MGRTGGLEELEQLVEHWSLQYSPVTGVSAVTGREISGKVMRESFEHFLDSGGNAGFVTQDMSAKLKAAKKKGLSSTGSISEQDLMDDSRFFSDEFFALLTWMFKIERGDASFCYSSDSQELYDAGHKLYEIAPIRTNVFVGPDAKERVSCRNFGAAIDTVRNLSAERARVQGWDVQKYVYSRMAVLFDTFNILINDQGSYVNPSDIADPQLWVRYEASQFFLESCKIVTGRSDFARILAGRNFPMFVKLLANIWDVGKTFGEITGIANKYNSLLDIRLKEKGTGRAVVEVTPSENLEGIAGKRFNACMQLSCDVAKHTMEKIPRLYGLNSYRLVEASCCVEDAIDVSDKAGVLIPKSQVCEYRYEWFPIATGWRRFLSPVFLLGAANIPLLNYVAESDASLLEKILMMGAGIMAPLGAAAVKKIFTQKRQIRDIESYHRSQENKAEQQRHDLLQREIDIAKTDLERNYSNLYLMSLQYTEYLRLLKDGKIDAALSQMEVLQDTVVKYLEDTALKGTRNLGLSDLRRKLDDAGLFIAFGEAVDGRFNPLTGKSGSAVFLTDASDDGANISKRFALKEMGTVEALVYSWFKDRGIKEMKRFPTPDVLAYRVVPSWDESQGQVIDVPIMVMEQIDGPTLYDFFRMLNNKVFDGSVPDFTKNYVDRLKDSVVDRLLERYCYLAEQLQSGEEGSLGIHLESSGVVRISYVDYVAKTTEVFDDCFISAGCTEQQKEALYVVGQIIGERLDKVKKVPFVDMGSLNASLPARSLYSRLLLLHEGVDEFSAEVSAGEKPVRTTMELALDDVISHMDDEGFREDIFNVCADELVRFDFEKLRLDTLEFDDLSHMTDFLPYGPSPERRAGVNARYIALRYVPDADPYKQNILNMIHEGDVDEAVDIMRDILDYSRIESERALVSIYRNLRWIRFYGDIDESKFDEVHSENATFDYHAGIILDDIDVYLREQNTEQNSDKRTTASGDISLDSSWQAVSDRGIVGALTYLKQYLENTDGFIGVRGGNQGD